MAFNDEPEFQKAAQCMGMTKRAQHGGERPCGQAGAIFVSPGR